MDEQKNLTEISSLTKSKHENLNSKSKILNNNQTNSSQNLIKNKKSNSKCLSSNNSNNNNNININSKEINDNNNKTEQIQLNNVNSNKNNTNNNLDLDHNQVKINLQNETISLNSKSNNNRKKFCNIKKMNRKAIKRPIPCLFAWTLLVSSTGAYYSVVASRMLELLDDFCLWVGLLSLQSVLFLYVIVNFLIATFRDPGRFQKVIISPDDPSFNDDTKSPLYKTVTIKKTTVKIKWCSTCNFYRPPRVSHCSICNACIDQFDHHCPWLNNCVGKRNYRFFFQFLGFLCLHMISIFSCCLVVTLKTSPVLSPQVITSILLMVVIVLLIFPIGGLFVFHIVLVSKGRTTNEHVTGKYKGMNFFSRGCCMNFIHLFWGSLIPTYGTVKLNKTTLSPKKGKKINDIESGCDVQTQKKNSSSSESRSDNEFQSVKENQRLTVSYSNGNNQEQELLDVVLNNKKNLKNTNLNNKRISSVSSDSSISSSMLNKSSRINQINNISIDSNRLSNKAQEYNNTSLNSNNLKANYK